MNWKLEHIPEKLEMPELAFYKVFWADIQPRTSIIETYLEEDMKIPIKSSLRASRPGEGKAEKDYEGISREAW